MFEHVRISPSMLSSDFLDLGEELARLEAAGADWVHVDVMDGHFVPNITMGVPVAKALKGKSKLPLDVHLMVENPLEQVPWFLDAGSDILTVHVETISPADFSALSEEIRQRGAMAGIAIRPSTSLDALEPVMGFADMVLVMSVEPGFSGQSYMECTKDRLERAVQMAKVQGASPLLQVDGGIGTSTCAEVASAGADVLVCGNAVFKADDIAEAISSIREVANAAQLQAKRRAND